MGRRNRSKEDIIGFDSLSNSKLVVRDYRGKIICVRKTSIPFQYGLFAVNGKERMDARRETNVENRKTVFPVN